MKFSRLLVLSALWLIGLSANAAVELIERTAPEQPAVAYFDEAALAEMTLTPAPYAVNHGFLLYNVGASKYFCAGNDYSTRASISAEAPVVYFVATAAAQAKGADVVELKNYVPKFSEFLSAFGGLNGDGDFYTDNNGREDRFWKVIPMGGNTYRLQNADYLTDKFAGWKGSEDDTRLYLIDATEGAAIDWQLFEVAEWTEYFTAVEVYNLSQTLKNLIETAEKESIDVTAAADVYNDMESTYDQIQAAIDALNEALANNISGGTADKPTDATALIVNPNFDNASSDGWLGTAPNMTGSGSHGPANVAEHYNKLFDTYQDLTNLPAGIYCLSLRSFFRGTLADFLAGTAKEFYPYAYAEVEGDTLKTLFNNAYAPMNTESFITLYGSDTYFGTKNEEASSSANGVTYYAPNNPSTFRLYCEEKDEEGNNKMYYDTKLFFEVQNGEARLGIKKDANQGGTDWAVFDTFGLKYYGNETAAYKVWVKESVDEFVLPEGGLCTPQYLEAYNAARNTAATSKAEALAAIAAAEEALAPLKLNVQLWAEYVALVTDADVVINDNNYSKLYRDAVDEWIWAKGEWHKANPLTKTNEELQAAIEELSNLILEAKKHPAGEGTDMTSLLTNPDFEQGETGWTGFKSALQVKWGGSKTMPTTGGTSTNTCAEAFSTEEFDLYQVVEGAPKGVYEIEVQGFCRNGRGQTAWDNYQNQTYYSQPGNFPVYVYLNAKQTPFVNVFSEIKEDGYTSGYATFEDNQYPDDMASAAEAFSAGMYKQKAYGLVAKESDVMRIGVKGHSAGLGGEDDNWVIFDNFKLTWMGYKADVIKPVLDDEIEKAQGKADKNMGKTQYTALANAIAAAQEATTGTDGEKMFECLSTLFEVENDADLSAEVFAPLDDALKTLMAQIEIYMDSNPTAAGEAATLYQTIAGKLTNHAYEDSEVEGLIDDINAAITKMKMPSVDGASDINPKDITKVINNPTFDENTNGWNGTKAAWGGEQGALAEFFYDSAKDFDFYQTFNGLPAGTYQVQVQGFYRAGYADNDYLKKDSIEYSHAYLYAQTTDAEENVLVSSKPLMRLNQILTMTGYQYAGVDTTVDDYTIAHTDTIAGDPETYKYDLVPNMMSTANQAFIDGYFMDNVVTIKITEGAPLRIGLKKYESIAKDWTIFDNWTLTYFGPNSEKEVDGDPSGIKNLDLNDTVKCEYFTLDGRKATSVQKGIIIQKMTYSNGAVVVRKVRR